MSLPWIEALSTKMSVPVGSTSTISKKRNKQHKDIMYPAVHACLEYVPDEDLKVIIDDMAHGILPKGFTFRNQSIAYTTNSRAKLVELNLDSEQLAKGLMNILATCRGMTKSKATSVAASPTDLPLTWKSINKKLQKKMYILRYVEGCAEKASWDMKLKHNCYEILMDWFNRGVLKMSSVQLENGDIVGIKSVTIDETGFKLTSEAQKIKPKTALKKVHVSRLYCPLPKKGRRCKPDVEDEQEGGEQPSESTSG